MKFKHSDSHEFDSSDGEDILLTTQAIFTLNMSEMNGQHSNDKWTMYKLYKMASIMQSALQKKKKILQCKYGETIKVE